VPSSSEKNQTRMKSSSQPHVMMVLGMEVHKALLKFLLIVFEPPVVGLGLLKSFD